MVSLRRREFVTLLFGTTGSATLSARAQQPTRIPRVGVVWIASQAAVRPFHDAFCDGLRDLAAAKHRIPAVFAAPPFSSRSSSNSKTAKALGITIPPSILLRRRVIPLV